MEKLKNYFGTDGIRGKVGEIPMTAEFIVKLGWAVGIALKEHNDRPKVIIGKDTRISGYLLESALEAGLNSAGVDVYLLGPMPTPGISYLTRTFHAQLGVVISASHNSFEDNGIKFFSNLGTKISKDFQKLIMRNLNKPMVTPAPHELGRAFRVKDAVGRYIEFCKSAVPHHTYFNRYRIVIDCANGATYQIAPDVFSELGAEVIAINHKPNGLNINLDCGSLHPQVLIKEVLASRADLGIAFDGDGDRVIIVDDCGDILDGDDILYITTKGLHTLGRFRGGIVGTILTNSGLEVALNKMHIPFKRVPVGDQNIIRALMEKNWILGGEPSGHIINMAINSTGDGIVAALQMLQSLTDLGKSLHQVKKDFIKFPQKSFDVKYNNVKPDLEKKLIKEQIEVSQKALGEYGRVVIRFSGTEPKIRVMVEGKNLRTVVKETNRLREMIESLCSEKVVKEP